MAKVKKESPPKLKVAVFDLSLWRGEVCVFHGSAADTNAYVLKKWNLETFVVG